jgi:hypothetical protein
VGGCRVVVLAVKLIDKKMIDKKIKRIKYIVALGGHQKTTIHTATNTKHQAQRRKEGTEPRPARSIGGAQFHHFGGDQVGRR